MISVSYKIYSFVYKFISNFKYWQLLLLTKHTYKFMIDDRKFFSWNSDGKILIK